MKSLISLCRLVLGTICLSMLAGPAFAVEFKPQPMRVVVVKLADPACEPDCPKWISAEGDIDRDTPAQFRRILKANAKAPLPIFIQSRGGDVDAALDIGRMIRKAGLDISVTSTLPEGCDADRRKCNPGKDGVFRGRAQSFHAYCLSACSYLIAGGKRRLVSFYSAVGVHQIEMTRIQYRDLYRVQYQIVGGRKREVSRDFVKREVVAKEKEAPRFLSDSYLKIDDYLRGMGVSTRLLGISYGTEHNSIHVLTQDELLDTALVTHRVPGELLLTAGALDLPPEKAPSQPVPVAQPPIVASAPPEVIQSPPPAVEAPLKSRPGLVVLPDEGGRQPTLGKTPEFDKNWTLLPPLVGSLKTPITSFRDPWSDYGKEEPLKAPEPEPPSADFDEPSLSASAAFRLDAVQGGADVLVIDFSNQRGVPYIIWRAFSLKNGAFFPNGVSKLSLSVEDVNIIAPEDLRFQPGEAFSQRMVIDRNAFCHLVTQKPVRLDVAAQSKAPDVASSRSLTFDKINWLDDKLLSVCGSLGAGEPSALIH